jgi:AcrR family transcriptional regulator
MSTAKRAKRQGTRGPKTDDEDVRGALLKAGQFLHAEAGFNSVPLRAVSDKAGVNQAMVRYYFKDKHGFEAALLDDSFDDLVSAAGEPCSLQQLLERLIIALNAMPWLPILLAKSVYLSTELRADFVTKHAPRLVGAIRRATPVRKGVDPGYAALSVLSMLIFPQLARPVVGRMFNLKFDDAFARSFSSHVANLFA